MTDQELLSVIRGGSKSGDSHAKESVALEELLSRQYGWISRLCMFEIQDKQLALDTVQESILEIAKSLHTFDSRSEFRTWAFTITKRIISKRRKREKTHRERFPLGAEADAIENSVATSDESTEEMLLSSEEQKSILLNIRDLPEQQRQAVFCHYFEDLSIEQTAERLRCSIGSVKTHLFRARERLRILLKKS